MSSLNPAKKTRGGPNLGRKSRESQSLGENKTSSAVKKIKRILIILKYLFLSVTIISRFKFSS